MTPDDAIRMCSELLEAGILDWWARHCLIEMRNRIRETGRVDGHQRAVIEQHWDRHGLLKGGA